MKRLFAVSTAIIALLLAPAFPRAAARTLPPAGTRRDEPRSPSVREIVTPTRSSPWLETAPSTVPGPPSSALRTRRLITVTSPTSTRTPSEAA